MKAWPDPTRRDELVQVSTLLWQQRHSKTAFKKLTQGLNEVDIAYLIDWNEFISLAAEFASEHRYYQELLKNLRSKLSETSQS